MTSKSWVLPAWGHLRPGLALELLFWRTLVMLALFLPAVNDHVRAASAHLQSGPAGHLGQDLIRV